MAHENLYQEVGSMAAAPAEVSPTIYAGDYRRIPKDQIGSYMPTSSGISSATGVSASDGSTGNGETTSNAAQDFGAWLNDITGIGNATQTNIDEAEKDRAYQTAERIAAQEYNSAEAIAAWERSEISAQKARDFEKEMSSTAYQRAVVDAMKAGINPMMLATGGLNAAGSVSGNAASSSAASISASSGAKATAAGNSASVVAALISAIGNLFGKFIPLLGS